MNDLTDLEICKKIAEITDSEMVRGSNIGHYDEYLFIESGVRSEYYHNPLADDALCFQLMVKHKITVEFTRYYEHLKSETTKAYYNDESENGYGSYVRHKSPNKAICLAIIEAHS